MEYFVSRHHWLDAQTRPLKKHLQRLVDTAQQILAQEGVPQNGIETAETEERVPVPVGKPAALEKVKALLMRRWLWAGTAAVLVALIALFVFLPGETAEQHYNTGVDLLEDSQYDLAILEFDKAIKLDANNAESYYNRGLTCYYSGEYDRAIADFTRAVELDPNYTDAYHFRADAYLNKGEYGMAIDGFSKAIELNPGYYYAYYDRGITYYYKGEYDMAVADITRAIEINSNDADFYRLRGIIYLNTGEYDRAEATADLEECIELSQDRSLTEMAEQALEELSG